MDAPAIGAHATPGARAQHGAAWVRLRRTHSRGGYAPPFGRGFGREDAWTRQRLERTRRPVRGRSMVLRGSGFAGRTAGAAMLHPSGGASGGASGEKTHGRASDWSARDAGARAQHGAAWVRLRRTHSRGRLCSTLRAGLRARRRMDAPAIGAHATPGARAQHGAAWVRLRRTHGRDGYAPPFGRGFPLKSQRDDVSGLTLRTRRALHVRFAAAVDGLHQLAQRAARVMLEV